jgi:hypothetical protein
MCPECFVIMNMAGGAGVRAGRPDGDSSGAEVQARQHDGDSSGADVPVGFGDGGPSGADRVLASAMTEI